MMWSKWIGRLTGAHRRPTPPDTSRPATSSLDPHEVDYWRTLRGRHAGRGGFVIGNGPSLKMEHLDRLDLKGFVSIASNKIYLAFDQTRWRPTYHTVADACLMDKIEQELPRHLSQTHVPASSRHRFKGATVHPWHDLLGPGPSPEQSADFSDDLTIGAFAGATITFFNLQFAAHLGLNPIYIIGCDHYYAGEKNVKKDQKVAAPDTSNHFITGYRKPGEIVNPAPIEVMDLAFRHARVWADRHGLEIYNCTEGGFLEAFKRMPLEQALNAES